LKAWRAGCASVCGLVLLANAWRLTHPETPSWDDAWYLETSFRLYHALKEGLGAFYYTFAHAFKIKAPLISVLPLPLYLVFGPSEAAAAWINQPLLVLTWYAVYRIGKSLYGERAGWAAAAACSLIPLHYGLSRLFFVDTLVTALATCAVWAVVEATPLDGRHERRGWLLGLGLLAKSIFPMYVAGPAWLKRKDLTHRLGRTLAVGCAVAATWYAFNLVYVAAYSVSAGFGPIARGYGAFSLMGIVNFWGVFLAQGLSWPYAASLLILAA
jgi:4-amino-4-deoxy-L-arabinose transferase-like glycosyltransferase